MGARANELLKSAEELLRERRFGEAIEAFQLHLEEEPRDVKALLELGICHLLNGSRQAFLRVYEEASRFLKGAKELPGDVARLWKQYRGLFKKVTAAALIVGVTALASTDLRASGHRYSAGVAVRPQGLWVGVQVDREGRTLVNSRPHSAAQLYPILRHAGRVSAGTVAITGDAETPYRCVASLLVACNRAGVRKILLASQTVLVYNTAPPGKPGRDELRIDVSAKGESRIGDKEQTPDELRVLVGQARTSGKSVVVQPAPLTPYKHLAAVLAACRAAKVQAAYCVIPKSIVSARK